MRNIFPLGIDLSSINVVRAVIFLVRVTNGAVIPTVLSEIPAVVASAVAVLSVIAITPSSSSACTLPCLRSRALSGLLELLSSDKLPSSACNHRYCCYLLRGNGYYSYQCRDIFFHLDRCFYGRGCEISPTLPYSAHARDCLHHVRLVPHFLL